MKAPEPTQVLCWTFVTLTVALPAGAWGAEAVDFARDIRPILSNKCFACHGPDEATREADLRLDTAEGATRGEDPAIRPGDARASLLFQRVSAADIHERMPPADSGWTLSAHEIKLLEQWIRQGAIYEQHWAFQLIERPRLPPTSSDWPRSPIDMFVLARLQNAGVTPARSANRSTLLRRVFLDLLGLPPTPAEIADFDSDRSPGAYERMVERALSNPHYGERWGRHWLDQARYADTNGYTVDSERSMWPYRDWVIDALNSDTPFDQFTIDQLAGDLLPEPSQDELVATGFHRNTLINQEGGTDAEQFRNEAVIDRVNTTGAVWLGLTVGCSQCHDHKFDPVTQRDYYRLFAFFNSQEDVNSTAPTLRMATSRQRVRLAQLDEQIAAASKAMQEFAPVHGSSGREVAAGSAGESPAVDDLASERQAELAASLKRLQRARQKFMSQIPVTMIMRELDTPRDTHVLVRGDFLRRGERVSPAVPAALPQLPHDRRIRPTRLDLARWLVDRKNPLTARVAVNRIWSRFFGLGLVETENDLGIQGTLPSHPGLLDWLAVEFMERGWSMKHLHRLILNSATYRQSSHVRQELLVLDPRNRLFGRQNRLRVEGEIVRDLGLAVAGVLNRKIGGRSVYPPQPDGVYAFTQRQASWPTSQGADRYRRGMYTFFMRSAPYPLLTTFDTPRFNTSCTRRVRSNTPLQSLTMANDETMIENARAFGRRLYEFAPDDRRRIVYGYQLCFARPPSTRELARLTEYVHRQREEFAVDAGSARQWIGDDQVDPSANAELAAYVACARALLNLDEFITRE